MSNKLKIISIFVANINKKDKYYKQYQIKTRKKI